MTPPQVLSPSATICDMVLAPMNSTASRPLDDKTAPTFALRGFSLVPLAIFSVTFLAYVDTLVLGFVFDDHVLIVTNDAIRSWRYFPTYFTSHIWAFRYPHLLANYYRPLFLTWLRLNDAAFGLHPCGWHLTSALAHLAATCLVYYLALKLTRDGWVAAVAGFIFGLHPVHAEAVADITSIQEPLSACFMLAAMFAFIRSREAQNRHPGPAAREARYGSSSRTGWLALALGCAVAALLSKESAMILPLLIACYVWIFEGNSGRGAIETGSRFFQRMGSAVRASIPFWLAVIAYVPVRIHALKGFAHVVTALPLSTVVFTVPSVLLFYLRILIWPFGLSCYYDTPYITVPSWREFWLPTLVVGLAVAVVAAWYLQTRKSDSRSARVLEFAAIWMALTILPVLNFRFLPQGEIAHDRYVYLPSIGFVILFALALSRWKRTIAKVWRPALPATLVVLVLGLGFITARQNLFWADDLVLNSRAHEIAPRNAYATTSLAAAVAQKGMDGVAMELYRQVLAAQPDFWRANVNLAYLDYSHGNYLEAAQYFERACAVDPTDGDEFLYLGMSLLRAGRLAEAESAIRTALLVRSEGKTYHLGLGLVLKAEGRLPEAKIEVQRELELNPQNLQAKGVLDEIERLEPRPSF